MYKKLWVAYEEPKAVEVLDEEEQAGAVIKADEDTPLVATKKKEAATFWVGVALAGVMMFAGESQGLAFNGVIGNAYTAARDAHQKVTYNVEGEYKEHVVPHALGQAKFISDEEADRVDKAPTMLTVNRENGAGVGEQ